MSFNTVTQFESALAEWWGAPYCVATDCCTHAVEISLIHRGVTHAVSPTHTYISIPFTLDKLNINWVFSPAKWTNYYTVAEDITDSAVYWQPGGYLGGLQCLSFQFKKPLNLGRGGAILCDNKQDYIALKRLAYDGRYGDVIPWAEQIITRPGYHYYMTPETAALGLERLPHAVAKKTWSWEDYPDLSLQPVFGIVG